MKRALQIILAIGSFGLAFSGWLSYRELFGQTPAGTCSEVGASGTVFHQPPCVYGFFMYLAIIVVTTIGLASGKRTSRRSATPQRAAS